MGAALEVINGEASSVSTIFTALTVNSGDSYTVRSANFGTEICLLDAWMWGTSVPAIRIRSPRMHDQAQNLRLNAVAGCAVGQPPHVMVDGEERTNPYVERAPGRGAEHHVDCCGFCGRLFPSWAPGDGGSFHCNCNDTFTAVGFADNYRCALAEHKDSTAAFTRSRERATPVELCGFDQADGLLCSLPNGHPNDVPHVFDREPDYNASPNAGKAAKPNDLDDILERAFWHFDALHKAHCRDASPALSGPMAEREAFKCTVRDVVLDALGVKYARST